MNDWTLLKGKEFLLFILLNMKDNHEKRITILETQQQEILDQVKNHIPTQIEQFRKSICEIKKVVYSLPNWKWVTALITIIGMLLVVIGFLI